MGNACIQVGGDDMHPASHRSKMGCMDICLGRYHVHRPYAILANLHQFDLVLIRSKVVFNGCDVDAEIGRKIMFASSDIHIPETNEILKYDRIGLLQVPSFVDEYDWDNLEVTEATHEGLKTSTLHEIYDGALEVCFRQVILDGEKRAGGDGHAGAHMFGKNENVRGDLLNLDENGQPMKRENKESLDSSERRVNFEENYFNFSGRLMNKPYGHVLMEKSAPMRRMFARFIDVVEVEAITDEQLEVLHDLVAQADADGHGISFNSLVQLFDSIYHEPRLLNSFSTAEIAAISSHYDISDDKKDGVAKDDFIKAYISSLKRTVIARKTPRPVLSGGFVSLMLQIMGLLSAEDPDAFYTPMDFADGQAPDGARKVVLNKATLGPEYLFRVQVWDDDE